jgi:hypothetical protein
MSDSDRSRRQVNSTTTIPRNDTAFSANTNSLPAAATSSPPIAGPTARPTLIDADPSTTAWGNSRRGTSSGWIACQAGMFTAVPSPSENTSASSTPGVTASIAVSSASAPADSSIHVCVHKSSRRRSTMSASAPAGSAVRNTGSVTADWTNATCAGDPPSVPISQTAPTFCIQVPMFDTSCAVHSAR